MPQVPAPPIAKVHRPSGWRAPEPEPPAVPDGAAVEHVELRSDAELEAFVHMLAGRLEKPDERAAILSGKVRFRLAGGAAERRADDDPGRVRRRH